MSFGVRCLRAPLAIPAKTRGLVGVIALIALGPHTAVAQGASPPANIPPVGSVGGLGDVNLYPKRVVIDDHQRIATIGLFNRAATAGDYDIALTDEVMTAQGKLVELGAVTDPALLARAKPASQLLRYSPHRVSLGGNDAQTVRILAHLPPDLPPGEYRTHFVATSIPPEADGGLSIDSATQGKTQAGIGVHIVPRFGISIPVIVRVGETTVTTGLRDLRLVNLPNGGKALSLTITRSGTRSAFGNIAIAAPGAKQPIARANGVAVYVEVDQRSLLLPVDPAADPRSYAPGSQLTVTYTDDDFAPGKLLARQDFTLP